MAFRCQGKTIPIDRNNTPVDTQEARATEFHVKFLSLPTKYSLNH